MTSVHSLLSSLPSKAQEANNDKHIQIIHEIDFQEAAAAGQHTSGSRERSVGPPAPPAAAEDSLVLDALIRSKETHSSSRRLTARDAKGRVRVARGSERGSFTQVNRANLRDFDK